MEVGNIYGRHKKQELVRCRLSHGWMLCMIRYFSTLSQAYPWRPEKYDIPPPITNPPTPISLVLPPTTERPIGSSLLYTSAHLFLVPTLVNVWSGETVFSFKLAKSIVTSPFMSEAPVNGTWPPLLTANWHPLCSRIFKVIDTSFAHFGDTRQADFVLDCWRDQ